jgi:nucleoside-diphosphate-sugar epimerase
MLVFVTGGTGFIGSCTISHLLARGHRVLGLTRSETGSAALEKLGVTPHPGSLQGLESLRSGACQADAVLHLGFEHDFSRKKQGLVTRLIEIARQTGLSAYIGDGHNLWPAVERGDAGELCALALEKAEAGARWHAVAEEGLSLRAIAEAIGRGLNVPVVSKTPEEGLAHFGWLGRFVGLSVPASSRKTREKLGWQPRGISLIQELDEFFADAGVTP